MNQNIPSVPMYDISSTPSTSNNYYYPSSQQQQQHLPQQQQQTNYSQQFTTTNRFNNVHHWHQNHFDSGIQSMQGSSNPSIMSYTGSQMSMCSGVSEVPPNNLSEQSLARIERVRTFFTGGDPIKSREAIPELLTLLNDEDEEVVEKAIDMLKNLARSDHWRPPDVPAVIDKNDIVFSVKETMMRYKNNKYIIRCCFCILFFTPEQYLVSLVRENLEEVLDALINGITVSEFSTYKYAIMNIHNLIKQKELGLNVIQYLREQKALGFIADWLNDTTIKDKLLSIIIDCINHICNKNEEQRSFFVINLYGIQKLIKIMSERNYSPLIKNICTLLFSIASSDTTQPFYSTKIVEGGVFTIVQRHLTTNDNVTLTCLLKLIWCISDISGNIDVKPLLAQLIHLIGHPDLKIKQLSIDSISNLIANKSIFKSFVCQKNIVPILIQLMEHVDVADVENRIMIEKVQEASLTVLSHLCSQHENAESIILYLPTTPLRFILLKKLVELRPAVLKQTLIMLSKLLSNPRNIMPFKTTMININGEQWYTTCICRVLNISFEQIDLTVEGIKISSLVRIALDTLTNFCKDKAIAEVITQIFCDNNDVSTFLPATILRVENNNDFKPIKLSALKLILELSTCGLGAKIISNNDYIKESLGHVKNSESDDLIKLADLILERSSETLINPPQPTYRIDSHISQQQHHHQMNCQNPEQYYYQNQYQHRSIYHEPGLAYPPQSHSGPPMYPPHNNGGHNYDYNYPQNYPHPNSCYDSQPMSINNIPQQPIIENLDERKNEGIEYIHPIDDVSNIPYPTQPTNIVPMDQDYNMLAPQSSPFYPPNMDFQ